MRDTEYFWIDNGCEEMVPYGGDFAGRHMAHSTAPDFGPGRSIAGPVIVYKYNLLMPMIAIAGKLTYKRLSLQASFAYSPWLITKDKDSHLLRNKFAKPKAYGDGLKVGLEGRFTLSQHWFLHISGDWLWLSARNMDQNWSDPGQAYSQTWSIDHEITSSQLSIESGVGVQF